MQYRPCLEILVGYVEWSLNIGSFKKRDYSKWKWAPLYMGHAPICRSCTQNSGLAIAWQYSPIFVVQEAILQSKLEEEKRRAEQEESDRFEAMVGQNANLQLNLFGNSYIYTAS